MPDPAPRCGEGNEVVIRITSRLRHDRSAFESVGVDRRYLTILKRAPSRKTNN
jgi:hypothetical protein